MVSLGECPTCAWKECLISYCWVNINWIFLLDAGVRYCCCLTGSVSIRSVGHWEGSAEFPNITACLSIVLFFSVLLVFVSSILMNWCQMHTYLWRFCLPTELTIFSLYHLFLYLWYIYLSYINRFTPVFF